MAPGLMCTALPLESIQITLSIRWVCGQPQRGGRGNGFWRGRARVAATLRHEMSPARWHQIPQPRERGQSRCCRYWRGESRLSLDKSCS